MQNNVNVVIVEGGVVKEPELVYTTDGLAYTNFPIATNNIGYKNGKKGEEVSYFDINCWGKLAEICSTYLKKGKKVIISGKLKQSRWKADDGKGRSKIRIVANDVNFLPRASKKEKA